MSGYVSLDAAVREAEVLREERFERERILRLEAIASGAAPRRSRADPTRPLSPRSIVAAGFVPAPEPAPDPVRAKVRARVVEVAQMVRARRLERETDVNCAAELAARVQLALEERT